MNTSLFQAWVTVEERRQTQAKKNNSSILFFGVLKWLPLTVGTLEERFISADLISVVEPGTEA